MEVRAMKKLMFTFLTALAGLATLAGGAALSGCGQIRTSAGAVGASELNTGIIGGEKVQANDPIRKSTAFILLYNRQTKDMFACSGVLVAPDLIVTAAHCFIPATQPPRGASYLKFVLFTDQVDHIDLNSPDLLKGAYRFGEDSYLPQPNYVKGSNLHDVAVIRLKGPLRPGLAPVAIMKNIKPLLSETQKTTVAGFGNTSENDTSPLLDLKKLTTTMALQMDPEALTCRPIATTPSQTPAHGDSGGPAFVTVNGQTYVWGVDSHSIVNAPYEYYTVLARYISWISQVAPTLGSSSQIN
jgi:secreted trypsin-like serine protease